MRILNVVSVLSAREGGGNAERTVQLTRALCTAGESCTVITLDIGDWQARKVLLGNASLVILTCLNQRFQVPVLQWGRIIELVRQVDVIHCMGHWSLLAVMVSLAANRRGVPYVVSPAGALPLFGRSKLFKQVFNWIVGRRFVRDAAGWIAVTKSELPDFVNYGVPAERIEIIPNGVLETDFNHRYEENNRVWDRLPSGQFILFMGRLNSIKGPDLLLEAFIRIHHDFPNVSLVFAGPDEGMKISLEQRVATCGLEEIVRFVGFVSGEQKAVAYHAATLLVVPSRMEAMSIVAVEAGICGKPVLITDQCGLSDLAEINAGLIVPATFDGLAAGLRLAFEDLGRLESWGIRWQSLVRERFQWHNLALKFRDYFKQVITNGNG
jgi:glycosyltransferase involved in cell wall biosynthesis